MEVLLFGSTGLLGSHLFDEFLRREWSVIAPTREQIDLFNLSQVNNFAGPWLSRNPDGAIVYAAGFTDITKCNANPGTADHLNVIAPFLLARLCKRVGARFVYYSTDQVFMSGAMTGFYQHHERDPLDGAFRTTQVYGASKAEAETFLGQYQHHLIIRTSWLFGEHLRRSNFVRDVVRRSLLREPIICFQDYVACPSYAPDVAAASAQLLSDPDASGTYHLVNGPPINRYEMAKTILTTTGLTADLHLTTQAAMGPDWVPRNPNGALNNTRGPKLRPWTDALNEYLKVLVYPREHSPA